MFVTRMTRGSYTMTGGILYRKADHKDIPSVSKLLVSTSGAIWVTEPTRPLKGLPRTASLCHRPQAGSVKNHISSVQTGGCKLLRYWLVRGFFSLSEKKYSVILDVTRRKQLQTATTLLAELPGSNVVDLSAWNGWTAPSWLELWKKCFSRGRKRF